MSQQCSHVVKEKDMTHFHSESSRGFLEAVT